MQPVAMDVDQEKKIKHLEKTTAEGDFSLLESNVSTKKKLTEMLMSSATSKTPLPSTGKTINRNKHYKPILDNVLEGSIPQFTPEKLDAKLANIDIPVFQCGDTIY